MSVTLTNSILPGQIYLYRVTAINATGEGSSATTVTYGTAPSIPSGVTAVSGISSSVTQVNLTWTANSPSENVVSYTIYRSTTNSLPYPVTISGVTNPNYQDQDPLLQGAQVYYYLVEADGASGKESISNTANAVAVTAYALPGAPATPTETDGNTQANLTWTAPALTTYPIAGYNIWDSANGGATVKANATPIAGLTSAVTGLTNGAAYDFFVQTVDNRWRPRGHPRMWAHPPVTRRSRSPGTPPRPVLSPWAATWSSFPHKGPA